MHARAIQADDGAMHIRDWPLDERPREKLLARGPGSLSDAELLAIFLGSGLRGRDAVATARDLLSRHGPLRSLLERPPAELTDLPGLGPARACALAAALELGTRMLHASLARGDAIGDPEAAGRYFTQRLRGRLPTKSSPPCSSTPAIACWRSRNCSRARWTARKCIPAKWRGARWP